MVPQLPPQLQGESCGQRLWLFSFASVWDEENLLSTRGSGKWEKKYSRSWVLVAQTYIQDLTSDWHVHSMYISRRRHPKVFKTLCRKTAKVYHQVTYSKLYVLPWSHVGIWSYIPNTMIVPGRFVSCMSASIWVLYVFIFYIFFRETAIDSIASTLFCHTSFYLFVSCKLYLQVIKARFCL